MKKHAVFFQNGSQSHSVSFKYVNGSLSLGIKRLKREIKTITPFYYRVEICVDFFFYILLTVHLNILILILTNLMH